MDKMIEVRYAGAVVSRSAVVRDLDARGLFIGLAEPLPVGTEVTLALGDDAVGAKVASVSESQELTRAGMHVVLADPSSAGLFRALADATPAAPLPSSGSARVMAPASASGSGSARVVAPASGAGSGAARPSAPAGSSPPVAEPKAAAPAPVPVVSSAPVPPASSPSPAAPAGNASPPVPLAAANAGHGSTAEAADDVDASGPVPSGQGGGAAGAGPSGGAGGGGGGGRRNRRNRRR